MVGKSYYWPAGIAVGLCVCAPTAEAKDFGNWGPPVNVETLQGSSPQLSTEFVEGCPIQSPYDDALYIASNRPGGLGGLDIWIARRNGEGWGAPENAGAPINSSADDFCPTPSRGNRLFFVSKRTEPNGDIYVYKNGKVTHLGPNINSAAQEWSPSFFETDGGREFLYFSSTRNGNQDIFYSVNGAPAELADGGVNSSANDARPNVRHDGLEMVWDSDRYTTLGGPDIFVSSRASVDEPWGPAGHLDAPINSSAVESRASLSWDGTELLFGSTRPGGEGATDVYLSRRSKITGK